MALSLEDVNAVLAEIAWKMKAQLAQTSGAEKPIKETTMPKMTEDKIGEAKKRRNFLRNKMRGDIDKFATQFGISTFEAAHCVLDSIILNVDNAPVKKMEWGLAQTLLPSTQAHLSDHPKPDENLVTAPPIFTVGKWSEPIKQVYTTAVKMKPDVNVTTSDVLESIVPLGNLYTPAMKQLEQIKETFSAGNHVMYGKAWLSGGNKWDLSSGTQYVAVVVPKSAPYASYNVVQTFKPTPASGYKWRKLKNKPIYKLVPDPKQKAYWAAASHPAGPTYDLANAF